MVTVDSGCCTVIGISCPNFNQQIKSYLVGSYKPEITRQTVQSNQKKKATYDFQSVKDLNLQTAAKARANKQSINTIGAITVPAINMTIPIANGVDNTTLALAAGTLRPRHEDGGRQLCVSWS
jgi:sortase A